MCKVTELLLKMRAKPVFYSKFSEIYNVFFRNIHVWTILGGCFRGNQNYIYYEYAHYLSKCHINSEVLPPPLVYKMLPSPRN
jgi:hypothetical protein